MTEKPTVKPTDKPADRALMRSALRFLKPHKGLLLLGALVFPLVAASRLAGPYLLKLAIDGPIQTGDIPGIGQIAAIYLGVVLIGGVLDLAKNYIMQLLGQRVIADIRNELFEGVTNLSMSYLDKNPMGKILTRLTSDVEALNEFLSSGLVEIVADGILLVGIVIVMFSLDAGLAIYALALMPFLIAFVALARKLMRGIFLRLSTNNARSVSYAQERISGMNVVQAFRREDDTRASYAATSDKVLDESLKGVLWSSQLSAVVELSSFLSIGLLLAFGAAATTSLGVLVAFIEYVQLFYRPVESLSGRFAVLQKALASAEKIFTLLDETETHCDARGDAPTPELTRAVEFNEVAFEYVDDAPVLRGLSLTIERGQTVAIVGATGAGKSSLVKLLGRFYEIQSGAILWDGQDIRGFDRRSLRGRIGYVPQETFLFSDTLADNILLGRAARERAAEAAKAVGADRIAADLPRGFDQKLGPGGRSLSAGERQLLAFARALAQDPDVLILDEATANIDGETEDLIQHALTTLLEGRTALVIAHRLSTIKAADKIVVLHKGQLREQGTHDELIARKGLYHTLYRLQSD